MTSFMTIILLNVSRITIQFVQQTLVLQHPKSAHIIMIWNPIILETNTNVKKSKQHQHKCHKSHMSLECHRMDLVLEEQTIVEFVNNQIPQCNLIIISNQLLVVDVLVTKVFTKRIMLPITTWWRQQKKVLKPLFNPSIASIQ